MWMEQSDVTKYLGDNQDPQTIIDKFYGVALAKLNELTCNALVPEGNATRPAIVQGDGTTLKLEAWYSGVTRVVTADGKELPHELWAFTPTVGVTGPDGRMGTTYGSTVELKEEFSTGDVMSVDGTYGFVDLPSTLKHALLAFMGAYMSRESGQDTIRSKSIEDVSVSTESRTDRTPEEIALETQQPTVDLWSLCDDKYNLGELSFPTKITRYPYYYGYEDRNMGGGQNAIGNVH